jgi:hypothetical protein
MAEKTIYDFVNRDICWTNTPYTPNVLQGLPSIEMIGYEQQWSTAITNINNWASRIATGTWSNPYIGLYAGLYVRTYRLPFFNEFHHNITQSWEPNNGPIGDFVQAGVKIAETAAKALLPAAGILYPQSYAGSSSTEYPFTFYLINTNAGNGDNGDIIANIRKNKDFLETFIKDNLHAQNNALSVIPPLIYEVYIPGVHWSPASVVARLTVNNKGTLNKYVIDNLNYIVPDAWEVTVTIKDLINESKSLWADATLDGGWSKINTRVINQVITIGALPPLGKLNQKGAS